MWDSFIYETLSVHCGKKRAGFEGPLRLSSRSSKALFRLAYTRMQIWIKTLTGRKQSFNFEAEDMVLVVKQALQEKEGIQVEQIRLIYSGKQLADDKNLAFYNVAAGGTIHMVLQLRG